MPCTKENVKEGLKTVTIEDVKNLHEYIMNNSIGCIVFNVPENNLELKDEILAKFNTFNKVLFIISRW